MLHLGALVAHLDVRKGVGAAFVAHQHRVALRVVARAGGTGHHLDQAAVAVARLARRNALADDGAAGVLADVDHLGAGVGLLVVVGHRHRIELAHRVVAQQNARRVLPGDGRAGLHLGPGNARVDAPAQAALGDKVVDAANAVLIPGVPVLHGGVLDVGVVQRHQFHHGGVQLVGVELGRGAAFQVGHRGAFLGHDQGALELPGVLGVDAEIGGQVHRALDALGDEAERAIGEHRRIERGVKVVS